MAGTIMPKQMERYFLQEQMRFMGRNYGKAMVRRKAP